MNSPFLCRIPRSEGWTEIKELTGGNKKERKFRLLEEDGQKCILRITGVDRLHIKHQEYANIVRLQPFGLNIPRPLQFGLCQEGTHIYMLLSWIDGITVGSRLKTLTEQEQFKLGQSCGATLACLHFHSKVKSEVDWLKRYTKIENDILTAYKNTSIRLENEKQGLNFLEHNKYLLKNRPQVIKHGDYHANNLIYTPQGEIGIIDFDRCMIADPYEEFAITVWTAQDYPAFARGQISGYFPQGIPEDFFPLLTYYITVYAFEHVSWALGYGKNPPTLIKKTAEDLINLFENYTYVQPSWYPKEERRVK